MRILQISKVRISNHAFSKFDFNPPRNSNPFPQISNKKKKLKKKTKKRQNKIAKI